MPSISMPSGRRCYTEGVTLLCNRENFETRALTGINGGPNDLYLRALDARPIGAGGSSY